MSVFRHPAFPRRLAALLLGAILAMAGCSDDDGPTTPNPEPTLVRNIDDLNYIRGRYFFLQRPAEQLEMNSRIDLGSVRVFIDDNNGANNQGVREGWAELDPTRPPASPSDTLRGYFDGLRELSDFQITTNYFGERFPVLILSAAIPNAHLLAVAYDETLEGGSTRRVGEIPPLPKDPKAPIPPMRLKMLQVPDQHLMSKAGAPDFYETDPAIDPRSITREYAIRSFYDLQATNIDPNSITIQVHRYEASLSNTTDAYMEGTSRFPYVQITGIDLFTDNGSGAPVEGPDGVVDQFTSAWFLEAETGVLYFPDLRPFDPRVTPRPDARPEEDFFFRTRLPADPSIPGLRERMFWPAGATDPPGVVGGGITPEALESNPNPYDKRNLQVVDDRRYYIRVAFY